MKARLKIRHTTVAAVSFWLFALMVPSKVAADTILFPVIAVNSPNVITVVSVMNLFPGGTSTHLKYTYRYKDALVGGAPNILGECTDHSFVRQTLDGDLVSFDASGSLNGGNALFGDGDAYGGGFALPASGAQRAYLLVTHSDAGGTRVDVGGEFALLDLAGEAIIMDIATGAAWGMKAINDFTRQDYTFRDQSSGGGVGVAMTQGTLGTLRRFSFFPPDEWTTRFFVTPIGGDMTSDLTARVNLEQDTVGGRTSQPLVNPTPIDHLVRCTAAIDLDTLLDSTVLAAVLNGGGWGALNMTSGSAVAYKLEFVVNNTSYGGTNNNGILLSGPGNF